MGFALAGSAASTLFFTMPVEKSSSVAFWARWSTMTWLRARGAMVATYWSVFVTVRIAQTEITEMGSSSETSTTSTHAVIPLVRRARGLLALARFLPSPAAVPPAGPTAATPPSGVSSESISVISPLSSSNA